MPLSDAISRLSVRRKATLILAVSVLPVLALMVLYATTIRQLPAVENEVSNYFEVQVQIQTIIQQIVDVQYGFRGFVLTRNEVFLEPYTVAAEHLDPALYRLKEMIKDE